MASGNAHLLVSLTLSTVTREQYIERSKERALALLSVGRIREAVASMMAECTSDCWQYRRGAGIKSGYEKRSHYFRDRG